MCRFDLIYFSSSLGRARGRSGDDGALAGTEEK